MVDPGRLRLRLFGVPAWLDDGAEALFAPERPYQLLAVLAVRGDWVSRDELAELLWPSRSQRAARGNLRTVIVRARRLARQPPLEMQSDRLRWAPDSDLRQFEAALRAGDDDAALALGADRLLQGLDDGLSEAGAAWLDFERHRLATLWRAAAGRRLASLSDEPDAAAALAGRLLASDPCDEAATLALVDAELALGRPARARQALDRHAARLAQDFGLPPSAAWRSAEARARQAAGDAPIPRPAPPQPPAASPPVRGLVGRRLELSALRARLLEGGRRWLTLTGPGGIGKSALARAALPALAPHFGGATGWVALEDLTTIDPVPARVAEALGIAPAAVGTGDPWRRIEDALAQRPCLLVFDNAEHLPALAPRLAAWRDACAGLHLIVTSRARLLPAGGDAPEVLLPLDGLPLPDLDETDADVLRRGDAVRLFEERALAAAPGFVLAREAADLVRLLHAVDGLPLAIELLAPWTRLLPVAQIAAELAGSLDLLDGAPTRERSVRASFAHSWQLIGAAERRALVRLALLPGPFGREMAGQVADAPVPMLGTLLDLSLLRSDGGGRFSLHPLMRQFAVEQAPSAGVDVAAQSARHAAHAGLLLARWQDPASLQSPAALDAMEAELTHIRAAWDWALAQPEPALASRCAVTLATFYRLRGLLSDGIAQLDRAAQALARAGASAERALAATWRAQGVLQFHAGQLEAAEATARRAAALARRVRDGATARGCLTVIGNALYFRGRHDDARPFFAQALRQATAAGDAAFAATARMGLGLVELATGRLDDALAHYQAAADAYRRQGNVDALVGCLNNIGNLLYVRGDAAGALAIVEESLQAARAHGLRSVVPLCLANVAGACLASGRPERARRCAEEALRHIRDSRDPVVETEAHLVLAQLAAGEADEAGARAALRAGLAAARARQSVALQMRCVIVHGQLRAAAGDATGAAAAWLWALAQPSLSWPQREATRRRLAALELPADVLERCAAERRGDGSLGAMLDALPA